MEDLDCFINISSPSFSMSVKKYCRNTSALTKTAGSPTESYCLNGYLIYI